MKHLKPFIAVVVVSLFGLALSYFSGNSYQPLSNRSIERPSDHIDQASAGDDQEQLKGQEVHCLVAAEPYEIELCEILLRDELDSDTIDAFKVTFAQYDLNSDGLDEIIAWESSWAGTSGGRLWVLERKKDKLVIRYVSDFGFWPPIGVLTSQNKQWFDLFAVVAGGGVEPHVVKLRHSGKRYVATDEDVDENDVTILIRTNIEQTVFGPRPK
jgi:hypothetical protein